MEETLDCNTKYFDLLIFTFACEQTQEIAGPAKQSDRMAPARLITVATLYLNLVTCLITVVTLYLAAIPSLSSQQ